MLDPGSLTGLGLLLGIGGLGASLMSQPSAPKPPDQLQAVQQPQGQKPKAGGGMPTSFLAGAKASAADPAQQGGAGMGKSLLGA